MDNQLKQLKEQISKYLHGCANVNPDILLEASEWEFDKLVDKFIEFTKDYDDFSGRYKSNKLQILNLYKDLLRELIIILVIKGIKAKYPEVDLRPFMQEIRAEFQIEDAELSRQKAELLLENIKQAFKSNEGI